MKLTPPTLEQLKDATLKMEMDHAKAVGLSSRDAEAENVRMLERSEQLAKTQPSAPKKSKEERKEEVRGRVVKRSFQEDERWNKPKQCRCERCIGCRRRLRIVEIMQKARHDPFLGGLAQKLMFASLQASGGVGAFAGLSKPEREKRLNACVNEVCDASVKALGGWRKFVPPPAERR